MSQLSFKERINYGWELAKPCYALVNEHKSILLFTALSGLLLSAATTLLILFILPYTGHNHPETLTLSTKATMALISFSYVMFITFISTSMNVALSFYASQLLEKQTASFAQSIGRTFSRFFTILSWSLLAAIVGSIVRGLQNKNNSESLGSRIALRFLGSFVQIAWATLTYFVTPLIAFENANIIDTIKKSGSLIQTTWGQAVGAQFFIGFYTFLYLFGFYALFFTPFYLVIQFFGPFEPATALIYLSFGFCAFFIPFILFLIINTTTNTIVKTALYHYAVGKPTGMFPQTLLKQAFAQTNKS